MGNGIMRNGVMGNGIMRNGVMGNGVIRAGESKSMDRNDLLCRNDSPVQTSQISGSQRDITNPAMKS
jgi:hypothetical protein